jgi:hypothetical protein
LRRHQLRRLVAGVAEHQPLVARALLRRLLALRFARVDALGDVLRLLGEQQVDEHPIGVEHVIIVDVADLADALARDLLDVEARLGGDLAADNADVRFDVGLARDAAELVLREAGVEHRVGDRVGNLVGMAFADGFRREDVSIAQCTLQPLFTVQQKSPRSIAGLARDLDRPRRAA